MAKITKTKPRAGSAAAKSAQKEARQAKTIKKLVKEEKWLKWGLIAALIIILLLLLWIGYATDWTRGLRKDSDVTPLSTSLDSSAEDADTADGTGSNGSGGTGGTGGSGGSDTGDGDDSTTSTTENRTTNNTTTNNTTTNNGGGDNGGGSTDTNLYDALLAIYEDVQVGDNLSDVVDRATSLGLDVNCNVVLLVETCVISAGDNNITLRGLVGTGLVTSVLEDIL